MSLSAIDSVGDAFEATKRFLVPFDRVRWFRLAVVMLFVTGFGFSFPSVPFGDGTDTGQPGAGPGDPAPGQPDTGSLTPELTTELLILIVGVVLVGVTIALLWMIVSAVMEFVFVESLGREEVRLRSYFRQHWRRGVRLFVFRVAVWLLSVGGIGAVLLVTGLALGGWPPADWSDGAIFGLVLVAIPVVLLAALVVGLFLGFTTVFVVPVMLAEDRGILSAWRRFASALFANPIEYLAYVVVNFLLGIVIGIASAFLVFGAALVIGIPTLIVAIPTGFVVGLNAIGGSILLVIFLVAGLLFAVSVLLIRVPFQTFLRYYALFILGDTDSDFDVIPTTRAAVRADGGTDDGPGAVEGPGDGDGPPDTDGMERTSGGPAYDDTAGDDVASDDATSDDGGGDAWNVDRDDGWGDDRDDPWSDDESDSRNDDGSDPWDDAGGDSDDE